MLIDEAKCFMIPTVESHDDTSRDSIGTLDANSSTADNLKPERDDASTYQYWIHYKIPILFPRDYEVWALHFDDYVLGIEEHGLTIWQAMIQETLSHTATHRLFVVNKAQKKRLKRKPDLGAKRNEICSRSGLRPATGLAALIQGFLQYTHSDASGVDLFVCQGWAHLFRIQDPVYREFLLEFYATVSYDHRKALDDRTTFAFRLGGVSRECSVIELATRVGIYTADETRSVHFLAFLADCLTERPDNYNENTFWAEITGAVYTPSAARGGMIRSTTYRMLHRTGLAALIQGFLQYTHSDASGVDLFVCQGWAHLFRIQDPVYREFLLEFYATVSYDHRKALDDRTAFAFRLGGVSRECSVIELATRVGIYTADETRSVHFLAFLADCLTERPDNYNENTFWAEITGAVYTPSAARGGMIRSTTYRMLHRLISISLTHHKNKLYFDARKKYHPDCHDMVDTFLVVGDFSSREEDVIFDEMTWSTLFHVMLFVVNKAQKKRLKRKPDLGAKRNEICSRSGLRPA
ncbi:unnamed protein product [Lactuca saligna]|uniref:Uncharacterized protein n=1 Tax=Lactuca saligna TaxID=75948 RepID=A0AA35ZM59_LACSI|nr:unnamed protein product [Lactuca saligna]